MTRAEAAEAIFTHAFVPRWDPRLVRRALRTSGELAHQVPCFDLGFAPGKGAIETVEEALAPR
jgi:hypothetical protein